MTCSICLSNSPQHPAFKCKHHQEQLQTVFMCIANCFISSIDNAQSFEFNSKHHFPWNGQGGASAVESCTHLNIYPQLLRDLSDGSADSECFTSERRARWEILFDVWWFQRRTNCSPSTLGKKKKKKNFINRCAEMNFASNPASRLFMKMFPTTPAV